MIARAVQSLSSIFLAIGGLSLIAMMLHISADVIAKLLWNAPIIGTLEIVSYVYMVGCTFLPLGHVLQTRSMIIVEAFTGWVSPRGILCLNAAVGFVTVAYFSTLALMGGIQAFAKTRIGEIQDATYFELPVWPMRWVLVASCSLAAIIALYNLRVDCLQFLSAPRDPERIRPGDHPT